MVLGRPRSAVVLDRREPRPGWEETKNVIFQVVAISMKGKSAKSETFINFNRFIPTCIIAVVLAVLAGCVSLPPEREIVSLLYNVPVGSSREEVKMVIFKFYREKYPNYVRDYGVVGSLRPVDKRLLEINRDIIFNSKKHHQYCRFYPQSK